MYYYKKEFLGEWMQREGVSTYELKEILGLRSTNNIEVWMGRKEPSGMGDREGRGWLPLVHILRLCNARGIRLSEFVGGMEGEDDSWTRRRSCGHGGGVGVGGAGDGERNGGEGGGVAAVIQQQTEQAGSGQTRTGQAGDGQTRTERGQQGRELAEPGLMELERMEILRLKMAHLEEKNRLLTDIHELHKRLEAAQTEIVRLKEAAESAENARRRGAVGG